MENDVYRGANPYHLWKGYSSDLSGLAPLSNLGDPTSERNLSFWQSIKATLDHLKFHQTIAGQRVIELAPGKRELFRDYCVQSGASEYVGVDPTVEQSEQKIGNTVVRYENQDALRFLKGEPDNSTLIASFMFLCDEMLDESACGQHGIRPEEIWSELLIHMFRVSCRGQYGVVVGNLGKYKHLIEHVGFVRSQTSSLLLLKPPDPKTSTLSAAPLGS